MIELRTYNGVNRATANCWPWYETTRRLDGERFNPKYTPVLTKIIVGMPSEVEATSREFMGDGGRLIVAMGEAFPWGGGLEVCQTILYQDQLRDGGTPPEHDERAHQETAHEPVVAHG